MTAREQIDKAIGAHGMWKARIRQAMETGKSEFNPAVVKADNNCDFGKWLYGDIAPELKKSPLYKTILQYHAEFHVEASRVLQLALSGKKDEAEKGIVSSSKYAAISASLTASMMEWKRAVA